MQVEVESKITKVSIILSVTECDVLSRAISGYLDRADQLSIKEEDILNNLRVELQSLTED